MKIIAIVQARMSSSRLPNKVLLPLAGKPVLGHVIDRLKLCERLDGILVATSIEPEDDPINLWCSDNNIDCFRGSLNDVLDRYYQAATYYEADGIVRITADCPLIDPMIVDEVVEGFIDGDFEAYSLSGEFPDGLDCQVFKYSAIARAWRLSTLPFEREHVGAYIENSHPEKFKIGNFKKFHGLSHHRWTLDEPRDYEFLKRVFERVYSEGQGMNSSELLVLLEREPDLMKINSGIVRNQGYLNSIHSDDGNVYTR